MASLGLNDCFQPSRHAFNQVLTHFSWNLIPFFHYSLSHLSNSLRCSWILSKILLEMNPLMFNRTEVWRLCRPVQESDIIVLYPLLGLSWDVLRIIVLLKNYFFFRNSFLLHARQHMVLQNTGQHPFFPQPLQNAPLHSISYIPIS